MKLVALEKKALEGFQKARTYEEVHLIFKRYLRLIEVDDSALVNVPLWLDEHMPEYISFEICIGCYRDTPGGIEVASIDLERAPKGQLANWLFLDDTDWNHLTIVTDFDPVEMIANGVTMGVREVLPDYLQLTHQTNYGVGRASEGGGDFIYAAVCVKLTNESDHGLKWLPHAEVMATARCPDRDIFNLA